MTILSCPAKQLVTTQTLICIYWRGMRGLPLGQWRFDRTLIIFVPTEWHSNFNDGTSNDNEWS